MKIDFNIVAYLIYLPATFYLTIRVGKDLHQRGELYIQQAFPSDPLLVRTVNRFLLIGYYLMNLGYAAISIQLFGDLQSWMNLFETIALRLGYIIMGLGIMHYINLISLVVFTPLIQKFFSHHS